MKHDSALGELSEGGARYLLIRNDSLMGLFQRLPGPARVEALAAFADSVAEHGGRSAQRYRSEDPENLLATLAAKASQLGWGSWQFRREADSITLTVRNSPFAQGFGSAQTPVCAPIAGMLQAVAGLVLAAPVEAREEACAAAGAPACRFRAALRGEPG